ncbi:MAG: flippase-like domain-containing protein [Planctomycetes bacterium]|nr:flippase-like domain-containing protein [Planctomycetota bacterium]
MATRRLSSLSIGLVLLGVAVSCAWLFLTGGAGAVRPLLHASPLFVVILLGVTTVHLGVRFVRWQYLLRRADVRVPARPSLSIFLASLMGTATPAYVGEVLRCALARKRFGAPLGPMLGVLVLERLLDVLALGLIGTLCASTLTHRLWMAGLSVGAALLIGIAVAVVRRVAHPDGRLAELRNPGSLFVGIGMSLAAWAPAATCVLWSAQALGKSLPVVESLRIFSHATLFGAVTLMPAGLGTTGSAAVFQLQEIGFSAADALPIVALFRLTTTGLALSVGFVFFVLELRSIGKPAAPATAAEHFDEIAMQYQHEYAPHVWKLLLDRKVSLICSPLPTPPAAAGLGLDFGCGLGHQCLEMRARGYEVIGIDPSRGLLRNAKRAGAPVVAADGLRLPFPDGTFDFAYAVGVLHHLPDASAQAAACREIARVLKPGGRLVVHETNTRNPLFRFYMGYVFPVLKTIDEGTEHWIEPMRWERNPDLEWVETRYFTFLPDTIPRPLLPTFLALERRLERSSLRPYAVHYMAVLRKPHRPGGASS